MTPAPAAPATDSAKAFPCGSVTVTEGIRVEVTPRYVASESDAKAGRFVFAYQVNLTNEGDRRAKLVSRHWIIVDADGRRREVKGEGVVGATPDLAPGDSHEYASFCPLPTPWGTMEGTYRMIREDGKTFDAQVGRFFLVGPSAPSKSKS